MLWPISRPQTINATINTKWIIKNVTSNFEVQGFKYYCLLDRVTGIAEKWPLHVVKSFIVVRKINRFWLKLLSSVKMAHEKSAYWLLWDSVGGREKRRWYRTSIVLSEDVDVTWWRQTTSTSLSLSTAGRRRRHGYCCRQSPQLPPFPTNVIYAFIYISLGGSHRTAAPAVSFPDTSRVDQSSNRAKVNSVGGLERIDTRGINSHWNAEGRPGILAEHTTRGWRNRVFLY